MQDSPQDQQSQTTPPAQPTQQSGRPMQQPPSISVNKEHAPITPPVEIKIDEVAKPPEISPELSAAGVEHGTDAKEHKLAEAVKQAGVTHAKETTPLQPNQTAAAANLPADYPDVLLETKKNKSAKNGISWRIRIILREWKKKLQLNT